MKIHRFITEYSVLGKNIKIADRETIKQIRSVLKIKKGEKIYISNGKSEEFLIEILNIKNNLVEGFVLEKNSFIEENNKTTLYLAILKKENFEIATQKSVECGITRIVPIITERTIKTGLNIERIKKIAKEASEQSSRNILPEISNVISFKDAIKEGKNSEVKILFHLNEKEFLPNKKSSDTSIFVGPEGGFTDNEIKEAKENGYKIYSLGKNTLRGETAAIIASYRIVNKI